MPFFPSCFSSSSSLLPLLLLLALLLAPSPSVSAGRFFGKGATDKEQEDTEEAVKKDWTHSRHNRKLETHVDEAEVLNLLRHDPVEMSVEEAKDWQHVKRKLAEARDQTGFFHRVEDAFVPPNSALRTKKKKNEEDKPEAATSGDAAFVRPKDAQAAAKQEEIKATAESSKKSEAEKEYGIFERARKRLMRS